MSDGTLAPPQPSTPAVAPSGGLPGVVPPVPVPPMPGVPSGVTATVPVQPTAPVAPPTQIQQPSTPPKPTSTPATLGGYDTRDADPVVQSLLDAVSLAAPEVNLERALGKALEHGDPSLIDREYLKEAHPQGHAKLAKLAEQLVATVEHRATELQKQVYAMVGGEQNWSNAVQVFNSKAPDAVRKAVATMLDSRNPEQILAGASMVQQYGQQAGYLAQVTTSPLGGAPVAPAQTGITYAQFKEALGKIDTRTGDYAGQWAALLAQRAQGKAQGLK